MIRIRPPISVVVRVGSVTSASEAINKFNAFVAEASPKHDLSTESWRLVWIANFGVHSDGVSPGWVNRDGIKGLLDRLDACAPSYAGGCDKAVDMIFEGVNRDLGLPADNGWITFEQMMTWLGRYPVNADDPPETPSGPDPGSGGFLVSRGAFGLGADSILASPGVVERKQVAPSPVAPLLIGSVASIGLYFVAGLSLLVSAIPVVAAGAYVVATRSQ